MFLSFVHFSFLPSPSLVEAIRHITRERHAALFGTTNDESERENYEVRGVPQCVHTRYIRRSGLRLDTRTRLRGRGFLVSSLRAFQGSGCSRRRKGGNRGERDEAGEGCIVHTKLFNGPSSQWNGGLHLLDPRRKA